MKKDGQLRPGWTPLRTGPKCQSYFWCVCAVTALGPGTPPSAARRSDARTIAYMWRESRRAADPCRRIAAGSDPQPAILEPRVRDADSAPRLLSRKLSRRADVPCSPAAAADAPDARRMHLKLYFKLYSTHTLAAYGLAYPC